MYFKFNFEYMSPNINQHCSKILEVILEFFCMLVLIFVCDYTEYSSNIWCFQAVWKQVIFLV